MALADIAAQLFQNPNRIKVGSVQNPDSVEQSVANSRLPAGVRTDARQDARFLPAPRLPISNAAALREQNALAGVAAGNARLAVARDNSALLAQASGQMQRTRLPSLTPQEIASGASVSYAPSGPAGQISYERKDGTVVTESGRLPGYSAPAMASTGPTPASGLPSIELSTDYAANNANVRLPAPKPLPLPGGEAPNSRLTDLTPQTSSETGLSSLPATEDEKMASEREKSRLAESKAKTLAEASRVKAEAQKTTSMARSSELLSKADATERINASKAQLEEAKTRSKFLADLLEQRKQAAERTPAAVSSRLQGILSGQLARGPRGK